MIIRLGKIQEKPFTPPLPTTFAYRSRGKFVDLINSCSHCYKVSVKKCGSATSLKLETPLNVHGNLKSLCIVAHQVSL